MLTTRTLQRVTPSLRAFSTTAPVDSTHLKFLVIDGYKPAGRENLVEHGCSTAGDLYVEMLAKSLPPGVTCESDIAYPADPGFEFQPEILHNYHGIAWTGSSLTIYHDEDPVKRQHEFGRAIFESRIPSFGSCWAMQLAAVVAGGICSAHPRGREFGVGRHITLTPEGRAHPMYEGKPSIFSAWMSHNDEVSHLPLAGSLRLASNPFCINQAMHVEHLGGVNWSIQYHPEYSVYEIARLMIARAQILTDLGYFRSKEDCYKMAEEWEELHHDPSRKDLGWKYGIEGDLLDENVRMIECRNWVAKQALPYALLN